MSSILSASSRMTSETRARLVLPWWRWSMRRPGVATHTSTPFLRSMRCSLMFVPPTTIVVLNPFDDRLKIFASFSICCASSRVGAMTMAKGPSPRLISGCWRQCWIIGMENAAVLPEPVSAHPRTSRPEQITGMACAWMGVGLSNSLNLMSIMILVSRFMSSKDSIGGGASSVPAGTSTVTSMRLRISSHWLTLSACTRSLGFQLANTAGGTPLLDELPPPPPLRLSRSRSSRRLSSYLSRSSLRLSSYPSPLLLSS
mmetsp:Transcript_9815/g.42788  ORF Transcript_9815/g.42788 Transcript_9815/m.42788 type:complete len:257 (-) Transcript_9815:227-997(-)